MDKAIKARNWYRAIELASLGDCSIDHELENGQTALIEASEEGEYYYY